MRKLQNFASCIAITFAAVAAGCGSNDSQDPGSPDQHSSQVQGVWSAAAYGKFQQFSRSDDSFTSTQYHVTQNSCVTGEVRNLSAAEIARVTRLTVDPDKIEIHRDGELVAPGVAYFRVASLPTTCTESLLPFKGQAGYVFNPRRDFQIFWDTFNEHYVDFALTQTDWQAVYSEAENQLPTVENEQDLFELFAEMITPLQDGHGGLILGDLSNGVLALLASDADFQSFSESSKPDHIERLLAQYASENALTPPFSDAQLQDFELYLETWEERTESAILGYANSPVQTAVDDLFIWFTTEPNIGYLYIGEMAGYGASAFDIVTDTTVARETLDRVMTDMQNVDGLIIDLRFNEGGEDEVSLAIASYFAAKTTHVYSKQARFGSGRTELVPVSVLPAGDKQFLKPVVVLTSSTTGSAAEILALSLRNFSNVTIAGEPSAGRLSNELIGRVTADIAFNLSNEFYLSPANEWFERLGIPVEHEIAFWTPELHDQGRDPGIEGAVRLLAP